MAQASMSQVGVQKLVPLLMVKSIETSVCFYIDGLGFVMTNTWTPEGKLRWCWLEHGTAPLMLQESAPDGKLRLVPQMARSGLGSACILPAAKRWPSIMWRTSAALR